VIEHEEKRFLFCKFVGNCPGAMMLLRDAGQALEAAVSPSWKAPRLLSFKNILIEN
jgi:hypothetical protein